MVPEKRWVGDDRMVLEKGDFVRIGYTGKVKDTGEVFDSTSEEKAEEAGIYRENLSFKPQAIVVGAGHIVEGLDEALLGMEVGDEKSVEVPPEKGFGHREPNKVKTYRKKEFKKQGIKPHPGMMVEVEGKRGRVQNVSGGRVVMDFNHQLAGKTLSYDINVEEKVNKKEEKVRLLIERYFPYLDPYDSQVECDEESAIIILPEEAKFRSEAVLSRHMLAQDIFEHLGLKEVVFKEVYEKKEAEEEEES